MSFFSELKRRHVVQVGVGYLLVAWGVAQVAELILDSFETPAWIMQVILISLAVGFPLAITLAWIFDLRWDGLYRESPLGEGISDSKASTQKTNPQSIAVLPFTDMSSGKDQEYFSDGISEELLNLLAKIKELNVIARTSSFSFKGTNKPISEIGIVLGVAYVLEGSVRKAGNRVRITAQLIETRNSSHLWSETYDRDLDDIFAIQDEISAAIVGELKELILGGGDIKAPQAIRTSNIEAYEHYLLGQQLLNKHTRNDITSGMAEFKRALEGDPDYAPAMVGLARAHLLLSNGPGQYGLTPLKQVLATVEPLLDHVLELSGESAETCGVRCQYFQLAGDLEASLAQAERAIALNPNYSGGYAGKAIALILLGDPEAPVLPTRRAVVERDPACLVGLSNLISEYLDRLEFDRSEAILRQIAAIDPHTPFITYSCAATKMYKGEYKASLQLLLAPEAAFSNETITMETQAVATELGHGEAFEAFDSAFALDLYASTGQWENARRVGPTVAAKEGAREDEEAALAVALWQSVEGNHDTALAWLTPFDEGEPDKWGPHFRLNPNYLGGTLSLYLHRKLGNKTSARFYLGRFKDLYKSIDADPDGRRYSTDFVGAVIAAAEEDKSATLGALERQIERSMYRAAGFLNHPLFEDLTDEPRYQALLSKVEAHVAHERAAAEAAGLLPISEELLARLNAD